ncbi:hypothetical protein Pyrfu_1189 [Pyrolobus fumarii 1A]|uniref:Uncharacterized protein n=1 Tax=Pyrolobus fumarii (strain DSM 11204 / 1A) TaxID=694429 RepID=G0EFV1_PYRF1|nr:hypothetical protein [Pyrolobus fumarii]AEM39052.1 hypothetical protein Pyrfu_1189 [Pyrolobus fumarii 1A]
MDLDRFVAEVASMGLPVDPVLDLIRLVYTVRELPYELVEKTGERRPR